LDGLTRARRATFLGLSPPALVLTSSRWPKTATGRLPKPTVSPGAKLAARLPVLVLLPPPPATLEDELVAVDGSGVGMAESDLRVCLGGTAIASCESGGPGANGAYESVEGCR
jgi:hypothetical protein